jgi:hypothetical protein
LIGVNTHSFWKTVAGSIAFVVGALMTLFAKLVAALTPFAIAMARAVTIIVSILGIYVMLLPGRFGDAIKWMIGPIAWANVWSVLFMFWWKVSEFFNDWGHRLFWGSDGLGDGISSAAVIGFVTAVGYTALPHIAWKLVFAMPERLMPHGGVGSMLTPAIRVMMAAGAAVGVKKFGRWLGGGSNASGTNSGAAGGGGGSGGGSPGGNGRPLPSNSATRLRAAECQNTGKGQRSRPSAKPVSNPSR